MTARTRRTRCSRLGLTALAGAALVVLTPVVAVAGLPPSPGNYTGKGFDQCDAPSTKKMDAWRTHSDFQAIGIYISGSMRACQTQANLTPDWVAHQIGNGWHLIPITVGRQSSCGRYADRADGDLISTRTRHTYGTARKQGRVDARDAVAAAQALGITPGSTLFNDMESWPTDKSDQCNASVMWYLSAWSNQLHAMNYLSGVYSSASTGIAQLDRMRKSPPATYVLPDYIWVGEWNGEANTDSDYIDPAGWDDRQRIHQYKGGHNETHGGETINIDSDWLDVRIRDVPPAVPNADRRTPSADGAPICRADAWADADRIGGVNRYDTAAKVALARADGQPTPTAVVASGQAYADALSAGFLTQRLGNRTGILLTRSDELPSETASALQQLAPSTVYVVGGTAVVSDEVVAQLQSVLPAGSQVVRLGGDNRYETNQRVNAEALYIGSEPVGTTTLVAGQAPRRTALLASGRGFADAMAASPATHGNGTGPLPLVLTRGNRLAPTAADQLNTDGIEQVLIVGGRASVPSGVEDQLDAMGIAVARAGGADRYETAARVADFEIAAADPAAGEPGGLGFDGGGCGTQTAYLANGKKFADALAGGPLAAGGKTPSPVLLTVPQALRTTTQTWLDAHDVPYGLVTALGQQASVDSTTLSAARRAIG